MKIAVIAAAAMLAGCSIPGYYATPNGLSTTRPDPGPEVQAINIAAAQKQVAERIMDHWEKLALILASWAVIYGFSKQLSAIHQVLVEIRQELWNRRG